MSFDTQSVALRAKREARKVPQDTGSAKDPCVRIQSSVTSIAWIPQGAIAGLTELPFHFSVAHYDMPPPDTLVDHNALLDADAIRFANRLEAWIEAEDGAITDHGQSGGGRLGRTQLKLGSRGMAFPAVAFPDLRPEPIVTETEVTFTQTAGGRTGVAAPRRVSRPPFVQIAAPSAWSTLRLTLRADGSSDRSLVGASPFPRHWVYDDAGELIAKSGLIDFDHWYREAFGTHTPWGDVDSPALVTAVESALERELSLAIVSSKPRWRRLRAGDALVEQGDPGDDLFLLFDGVLEVEIDGEVITQVGPGAILGEMASLEDGRRTATLRAVTPCRVAAVPADQVDRQALSEIAERRRAAT